MSTSLEGWSPAGIVAAVTIVAGIVLLIAYAVRRGLVNRELEGIENEDTDAPTTAPTGPAVRSREGRSLGIIGSGLLVVGLVLGLATAIAGWGGGPTASGAPGALPSECLQGWNGCPQVTPKASTAP